MVIFQFAMLNYQRVLLRFQWYLEMEIPIYSHYSHINCLRDLEQVRQDGFLLDLQDIPKLSWSKWVSYDFWVFAIDHFKNFAICPPVSIKYGAPFQPYFIGTSFPRSEGVGQTGFPWATLIPQLPQLIKNCKTLADKLYHTHLHRYHIQVCLKMLCTPINPMVLLIIIWKMAISLGILTQHFQTNPYSSCP